MKKLKLSDILPLITNLCVIASYIFIVITKIWIVVSFLIYLVKDKPFQWASVWLCLLSWVLLFISFIFFHVQEKDNYKAKHKEKSWPERLKEMQDRQAAKIKNN